MNGHETEIEKETDVETGEEEDFEYDENGDIIIPRDLDADEDPDDEEEDEEDSDDGEEEAPDFEEEAPDGEPETDADGKPENDGKGTGEPKENASKDADGAGDTQTPEPNPESERKDRYIASLEAELRRLKSQAGDALKKLGVKAEDEYDGLIRLAAEAEDKTPEEYRKIRAQAERDEEERLARNRAAFEEKMRQDLAEVQASFPEAKKYRSVKDFPNFAEFGKYRDAGLSPKKAFLASHEEEVRGSVASAVRRQSLNETKNHLRSAVSKGTRDDSVKMSKKELSEWRGLFPDKSDREILALYRKTN